jgi:hypothetical protein
VPEELPIGKKWFAFTGIVFAGALGLVLPWWQALLAAAAAAVGWLPALVAAAGASTTSSVFAAQLAVVIAFATGSRWRASHKAVAPLYATAGLIAVAGLVFL